jgi:hypothetical protein
MVNQETAFQDNLASEVSLVASVLMVHQACLDPQATLEMLGLRE